MYRYTNNYDIESQNKKRHTILKYNILFGSMIVMLIFILNSISSLPIYKSIALSNEKSHVYNKINVTDINSINELDDYIDNVYNEIKIKTPANIGLNNSLNFLHLKLKELDILQDKYTFREINELQTIVIKYINKYKHTKELL